MSEMTSNTENMKKIRQEAELLPCFTSTLTKECFQTLCGDYLGTGLSREVYQCAFDPTLVIKIESKDGDSYFQNVREWTLWRDAVRVGVRASKWFAPCVFISPCGLYLVQKKCIPLGADKLPRRVPVFFTDIKRDNWGDYNGRPVCYDYAINLANTRALESKLTRSACWD